MTFNRLSYSEEIEVNWHIQVFVQLGNMCQKMLKYAYMITLPNEKKMEVEGLGATTVL
jgi:hypothetical protein